MQNDIENILNEIVSKGFERKDGLFSLRTELRTMRILML